MADPNTLVFSPPLRNPPLLEGSTERTSVEWTVSGGIPPYAWKILPARSGNPISLVNPPIEPAPSPIDPETSPILLSPNGDPGTFTATELHVQAKKVYAQAAQFSRWVRVEVEDSSGSKASQCVWVGEMLLYDPDGKLWVVDSSKWKIAGPPSEIIPKPTLAPGSPRWGIAWAPSLHDEDPGEKGDLSASLTCYILNQDALHEARMMIRHDAKATILYPLAIPFVCPENQLSEDDE